MKVVLTVQRFGWSDGGANGPPSCSTTRLIAPGWPSVPLGSSSRTRSRRHQPGLRADAAPIWLTTFSVLTREIRAELDKIDPSLQLSVDVLPGAQRLRPGRADRATPPTSPSCWRYNLRTPGAAAPGRVPAAGRVHARRGRLGRAALASHRAGGPGPRGALVWAGVVDRERYSRRCDDQRTRHRRGRRRALRDGRRVRQRAAGATTTRPRRPPGRSTRPDSAPPATRYGVSSGTRTRIVSAPRSTTRSSSSSPASASGRLGHEAGREEMWWAARDRLRPRDDDEPPNGSASIEPDAGPRCAPGPRCSRGVGPAATIRLRRQSRQRAGADTHRP